MTSTPLAGLVIRAGVVRRPGLGFIYAGDPKREADDVPHAVIFKFKDGSFERGECNYNALSACSISKPQAGLVDVAGSGYFTVNTASGPVTGDLFERSAPPPPRPRSGGIRAVSQIAGQAYAVGLRGLLYRLDKPDAWTRIDDGLPETFDGQAVHGFGANDIYAAGRDGQIWHFDGVRWAREDVPTSATLTCIHCAEGGTAFAAGHQGALLLGRAGRWQPLDPPEGRDALWDVHWFRGQLYVFTMRKLYRLSGEDLVAVDFGADPPKSCYRLSSTADVLWSIGEFDVMSFDGSSWSRIV